MGNRNSGRRPQPSALKVLRGNPGQRSINAQEPRPPIGPVDKPKRLSGAATVVWEELAPVCEAMGTLTKADAKAFATLCELQATLDMASAQKDADGFAPFTVGTDYNDAPVVKIHAALKLERETASALRPYYEKFGLEPSGRARISLPKQAEPASKWGAA